MEKRIVVVVATLALAGCMTPQQRATADASPEMTFHNVRTDCIKNGMVNGFVNGGYRIESTDEYRVVAIGPASATDSFLYGSRFNGTVLNRYTATFIPLSDGNSLRVVFSGEQISNPGSAFEKSRPIKAGDVAQGQFSQGRTYIESKCART